MSHFGLCLEIAEKLTFHAVANPYIYFVFGVGVIPFVMTIILRKNASLDFSLSCKTFFD